MTRSEARRSPSLYSVFGVSMLLLYGVGAAVLGGVFLYWGMNDYSDHTARAKGTVIDVERHSRNRYTVYVGYRAEGREYPRVKLVGGGKQDTEGETLDVVYAPGKPDHVVTPQSAWKGAYDSGRDYGFVFLGAGAVLITVGTVRTRRARRTRRQAG